MIKKNYISRRFVLLGLASMVFIFTGKALSRCSVLSYTQLSKDKKSGRIVSLAPSVTETLLALGLTEEIIAVSVYCEIPTKGFEQVQRLGTGQAFSLEAVLSLNPDLILGVDLPDNSSLPFYNFHCESLADVLRNFKEIAKVCGIEEKGEELYDNVNTLIEKMKQYYAGRQVKTVLVSLFRSASGQGKVSDLCIAGNEGYYSELLKILSAENVYKGNVLFPMLSEEGMQKLNPDIIIDLVPPELNSLLFVSDWDYLKLSAVTQGQVYKVGSEGFVPGPRVVSLLRTLERIIYGGNYA